MQGDLGRNANIIRCDNIGHCKNNKSIWTCVEFWMVTEMVRSESTNKKHCE